MGGDDFGVKFARGIDVVIVSSDASFLERFRLFGTELAEGDADFHTEIGDVAHDIEDLIKAFRAAADSAPGGTHAEASGAVFFGRACAFHDVITLHEAVGIDPRIVASRLGAVRAVFGTTTSLDGKKGAELDLVLRPILLVNLTGFLQEVEKRELVVSVELVVGHFVRKD